MIAYASITGNRRNLAALRRHGWRLLVSPKDVRRTGDFGYALDNGAWSAFQQKAPFDAPAFERALGLVGSGADWVVAPDIVAGGARSLELSMQWMDRCLSACSRVLIAVQDGIDAKDVSGLLGDRVGLFVGGSSEWKERTVASWSALCEASGAWCHVGRVNSVRRIKLCLVSGATSFDGTSASRYSVTARKLDNARRQTAWTLFR